jgi:hypothetical protein
MKDSVGKGERGRPHPPFAQPDPGRGTNPVSPQLPSIEQFVDDLPSIEEFRMEADPKQGTSDPFAIQDEGWAAADWQSYDWSGIASLGARAPEAMEAQAAWSSTDWDSAASGVNDTAEAQGGLPGNEVAAALDEIARRIRSGQLSLERFRDMPPEEAIAAVFAALLRARG